MNSIIFEGVRCFSTFQQIPIRPITLLVGENSSGKSTFLALARLAWDITLGDVGEDLFNEEPFLLGAYDQIASYRGGRGGQTKSFLIGHQVALNAKFRSSQVFADSVTITARFVQQGAQAKLDEWRLVSGQFSLNVSLADEKNISKLTLTVGQRTQVYDEKNLHARWFAPARVLRELPFLILQDDDRPIGGAVKQNGLLPDAEISLLQSIGSDITDSLGLRPYASAPIRTRPQRTYDPLRDVPKPEGSHVPMILANIHSSDPERWDNLRKSLNEFGQESGLFTDVEIRRKGHKESDPFQIGIKTSGPAFNLVDVGYGVSQVLPVIVDAIQEPPRSNFLLQQAEVHLHPKAQAALGTFLCNLVRHHKKRFVIETHSDYLMDRIRMDIRDKRSIGTEDVMLLYFEKTTKGVVVNPLTIDQYGNIVDAPQTYRQFFLQEERRMLMG
jgi:hypothetical protein